MPKFKLNDPVRIKGKNWKVVFSITAICEPGGIYKEHVYQVNGIWWPGEELEPVEEDTDAEV